MDAPVAVGRADRIMRGAESAMARIEEMERAVAGEIDIFAKVLRAAN